MKFAGTERVTIELAGAFDPASVPLPAGLEHDGGRVSLFAFHVEKLRIEGIPLLSWSYPEVLWRIAVRHRGEPCWWVTCCDLQVRGPAWAARRYVRYDVRKNEVIVDETRLISRGRTGELSIEVSNKVGAPLPIEQRPVRVGDGRWVVPWGDDGGNSLAHPIKLLCDTLSEPTLGAPVKWADRAVLRRGRPHRCGVAHV
jgi:hypothetical protein